jgi:hypothetical protein
MYVQALRAAERFGPFKDWANTPARLLGGRLAIQLGAARLGRWLHLRAYRDTPAHPEAIYYHGRYRLERFGPLGAWKFLRSHPDQDWNDAAPEVRADWYGLHAFVCARLRDFDRAERWLAKAETLSHDRAWLCVERAAVLEFAERPAEALAVAAPLAHLAYAVRYQEFLDGIEPSEYPYHRRDPADWLARAAQLVRADAIAGQRH